MYKLYLILLIFYNIINFFYYVVCIYFFFPLFLCHLQLSKNPFYFELILFFSLSILHVFTNFFHLKQFCTSFNDILIAINIVYRNKKKEIFSEILGFRNDYCTHSVSIVSLYELTYFLFCPWLQTISHVIMHISITTFVLSLQDI